MQPLRPYQEKAVSEFVAGNYKYLASDAGTGKTRMAIEIALRLKAKRILVLCPAIAKIAWVGEIKEWAPHHKFHTPVTPMQVGAFQTHAPLWTIINYDKFSRGHMFLDHIVSAGPYDLLVMDEAHYCKDLDAARTKLVYGKIAPVCKTILPMSATPMTCTASDLYAPIRYLAPEKITTKAGALISLKRFQDVYCEVKEAWVVRRGTGGAPKRIKVRQVTGSKNIPELNKRLGGFFYRLRKGDCLPELPAMQFVQTPIALDREDYTPIKRVSTDDFSNVSDDELFDYSSQSSHIMKVMRLIGEAKAKPAAAYVVDFLEGCDEKCVVWAKHTSVIDELTVRLQEYAPAVIDGRYSQEQRMALVDRFLADPTCRVFIGQIIAAGTALTLLNETVQPRNVFFVESDWSPANNYQAASRVHRLGQRNGVLVRVLTAQGVPLDMRLQRILTRKTEEFAQLIDGEKNDD